MNTKSTGNPEALKGYKNDSQRQTRQELELALARLRNGNPKRVKRGTPITATSVAQEADVNRTTLYRYHQPVLNEIQKHNDATPKQKLEAKRGELADAQAKAREYRLMAEDLQTEMNAWARQNYALAHRVQELDALIRERDKLIAEQQGKLREAGKVVTLWPASAANPAG